MSESQQQVPKTLPANLTALQRELDELFRQAKRSGPPKDCQRQTQGPVLIIRGK